MSEQQFNQGLLQQLQPLLASITNMFVSILTIVLQLQIFVLLFNVVIGAIGSIIHSMTRALQVGTIGVTA